MAVALLGEMDSTIISGALKNEGVEKTGHVRAGVER